MGSALYPCNKISIRKPVHISHIQLFCFPFNASYKQKTKLSKLWNYLLQVFLVRFSSFLPSNDWRNLTIPVYTGCYIQLFHYSHANFEEFVAGRKENLTRRIFFQHYYSMSEINHFQRYRANFVKAFFLSNS